MVVKYDNLTCLTFQSFSKEGWLRMEKDKAVPAGGRQKLFKNEGKDQDVSTPIIPVYLIPKYVPYRTGALPLPQY